MRSLKSMGVAVLLSSFLGIAVACGDNRSSAEAAANRPSAGPEATGATSTLARAPGSTFRDCADCPEMVVIPAGHFTMGSTRAEAGPDYDGSEEPVHVVTIARAFAVGKYEVTRDEWKRFVADTHQPDPAGCNIHSAPGMNWPTIPGLNWHNIGFAQTGRDPAVCLSWNEAQRFIGWLNRRTGQHYRMLSEAEWEYAARAGTTTAHYWGDHDDATACLYANGSDITRKEHDPIFDADQTCRDGFVNTSPAGSFRPNAFGLFDMMGNVAEMTEDCFNENYRGAPTDGAPWHSGDCRNRINRGDTWTSTPGRLRSAARGYDDAASTRVVDLGFRLARAL